MRLMAGRLPCLAVLLLLVLSAAARADNTVGQASKVLKLNRDAMEMFSELELELCVQTLEEAWQMVQASGLGQHAVAVRTLVNLGIVHAVGYKERDRAADYFSQALALKPDLQLTGEYVTPESREAFNLARARAGRAPSARVAESSSAPVGDPPAASAAARAAGDSAVPVEKTTLALRCPQSGEIPDNDDVILRCIAAPGFAPSSVVLHYRPSGSEEYLPVAMKMDPGRARRATWTGVIPASALTGTYVSFYVEAQDSQGTVLAQSGRFESPSILTVLAAEPARRASTVVARRRIENPLLRNAHGDDSTISRQGQLVIGLALGSGIGYAMGRGVEIYRPYTSAFTPGLAGYGLGQALPEIGYHVTNTVTVTVQARLQYIPRPDTVTAGGAVAALGRVSVFSGSGRGRFYGVLALGGGEGFRLVVQVRTRDGRTVQDTVRGGPVVVGAGGGFSYDLNSAQGAAIWSWVIETNVLAGFPDPSLALDINTGMRVSF